MFAKIFNQIFDSSIANDYRLRQFFMDMLVLAECDGVVDMTPEAIAARTRMPLEEVLRHLVELEKPDPRSRSHAKEGRRIIRIDKHRDWGWQIVNYDSYRKTASDEQRREKTRTRVANLRAKNRVLRNAPVAPCNADVTHGNAPVTPPNAGNAMQRQSAEAEADAKVEAESITPTRGRVNSMRRPVSVDECITMGSFVGVSEQDCRDWFRDCEAAEWKRGDGTPFDNWPKQLTIHRDKLSESRSKTNSYQGRKPQAATPDHAKGWDQPT